MRSLLLAVVGCSLPLSGAVADEIRMYKGKDLIDVTVVEESIDEIKFRMKGISQPQSRPSSLVKEVVYSNHSDRYFQALEAMDARDYDKAVMMFRAAAGGVKKSAEWEVQYSLFHAAECLRLARQYDEAVKAYDELIAKVPRTKFIGRAFEQKALCHESKNDVARAVETFQSLKAASIKLGPRFEILADFHVTRLGQKNDPAAALEKFRELRARAEREGFSDIANLARLGVGTALIGQGKLEEARAFFQEIIKDRQASEVRVVAGAYLGLGNTFVASKAPTAQDFDAALMPFLRVVFMYGPDLGNSPMVAEAAYWAGRCFESKEARDEKSRVRKVFLYQMVVKDYPGSDWARQAQVRL